MISKRELLERKLRKIVREELSYSKYDDPEFDDFLDNVVKRFDAVSSSIRRALYRLRQENPIFMGMSSINL